MRTDAWTPIIHLYIHSHCQEPAALQKKERKKTANTFLTHESLHVSLLGLLTFMVQLWKYQCEVMHVKHWT